MKKKAAEAAFKGVPFDPKWSEEARKVYLGLSSAMANKRNEAFQQIRSSETKIITRRAVPESKQRSRIKSTLW